MDHETITQINRDQYQDDLAHKVKVYDQVKGTIKSCMTLIQALEPTTKLEGISRKSMIDSLDIARQNAILAATDVELERRTFKS